MDELSYPEANSTQSLNENTQQVEESSPKEREAEHKSERKKKNGWFSPSLLIAICSAISAIAGTFLGAAIQGYANFQLERQEFEFSLIRESLSLENFENEKEVANSANKLLFLVETGIVQSLDADPIRKLAEEKLNKLKEPRTLPAFRPEPRPSPDWRRTASHLKQKLDKEFSFSCSPGGIPGTIWGTDLYTSDSSICTAAVHYGLIKTSEGGKVKIRIKPGENSYQGTLRNGIRSQSWGSWSGSFIFVDD